MPEPVRSTERDSPRSAAPARPTICLVLHAYQPPNIADSEVEQTVRCVYQPLLTLHAASAAPLTLNVQGCLLRRLQAIAPNFLEWLRELARSKLLEFTTSAHYHPCLPLLPRDRRKRQIALNLQTVQEVLDVRPRGFWPPELAWSPAMLEQLVEFDVRWTIVDGSAFVRAWSFEETSARQPAALYLAAELMQPYAFVSAPGLIAVPRQHEWSRRLFEQDTLVHSDKLDASIEAMRMQARGLICLATDAERIAPDALRLYERLLRALSEFSDLSTTTMAVEKYPANETIDLPVWTWRGALDEWVRGEAERSFLREIDDAYRRRANLMWRPQDSNLAAAVDDSLMRAESSCWLFWRSPYRFLAEGFAQIERANRIMDPI
jgi:alpha-amylase/alpha-mannosidase (GH57 family)